MVIGHGLLARQFQQYEEEDGFLVFASGVSNSKNQDPAAYAREFDLLKESIEKNDSRTLIYFSTCSIYDPFEKESRYVRHKLQIEEFIQTRIRQFYIFRISNLTGTSSNPNTVINYFFNHISNGVNFDLWVNACRNIIDIDDAYLLMNHILRQQLFRNQIINIANPVNHPVHTIITAIESYLKIKSNYIVINKGSCFDIDTSALQPVIQKLGIEFDNDYLTKQLSKYY